MAEEHSDEEVGADEAPLHGFQGDRPAPQNNEIPLAPSLAISREVGARGGDIARRIGRKQGWTVYDSEVLGYSAQDPSAYDTLLSELPPSAAPWIEKRMRLLHERGVLADDPNFERVSRLVLALGAKGEAIFVGRGAGFILPRSTTLHVRLTAPLADRVSYMSQWMRLPHDEAAKLVRSREFERTEFLAKCFCIPAREITYDMVLDSSALGGELCAQLITQALGSKRREVAT
jgi:cytidylate kinase